VGNFVTFLSPVVQDDKLVSDRDAEGQDVFDRPNDVIVTHVFAGVSFSVDCQDARMLLPL
jgi:hypothetical protein